MRLRGSLLCTALAAALLAPGAASAAEPKPAPKLVTDPHYGDTLFHFYQGKHFTAITGLMVSQHFNRVSRHADEAEVLRGGMLLAYGQHREAGQIFNALLEKTQTPSVRDRAWYYVAKIRYQRGLYALAEDAINRIGKALPAEMEEERGLLHAQLLMARQDYAGAAEKLAAVPGATGDNKKEEKGRYARFNLGVALLRGGDAPKGVAMLNELGQLPASNEEYRALRDRANVALGYAALQDNQPEQARVYLERVRLNGRHATKALLGFGWAASALKNNKLALVPWTELAERDVSDPAVLEGRIAVAYAFADLGANGQALERYQQAINTFEQEGRALDESIAAIRSGKLVDDLLQGNPGEELGWSWNIAKLPQMPHTTHLTPVLAQHEFQEAFKNVRDLQFLSRNLQAWSDNLGVFGDMLATRRQAFAERLPKVRAGAEGSGLAALAQRAEVVVNEVKRVEEQTDTAALADSRQPGQQQRLKRVEAVLAKTNDSKDPDIASARERLRRVAGALTWQFAQEYPARLWDAKKSAQRISAGVAEARRRDQALAQAQVDEPKRFEDFAARIAVLDKRLQTLSPQVASLRQEQQLQLQDMAIAQLAQQKERLAGYVTQARFAVAQLQDRATSMSPDTDTHATKR
jgi:outer membrane protein assembly factor BamD (BamD/ComL family)